MQSEPRRQTPDSDLGTKDVARDFLVVVYVQCMELQWKTQEHDKEHQICGKVYENYLMILHMDSYIQYKIYIIAKLLKTYPLYTQTLSGRESVCNGSTIPSMGRKAGLEIPVFAFKGR